MSLRSEAKFARRRRFVPYGDPVMFATETLSESQVACVWVIAISLTTFTFAALVAGFLGIVQRKA